MIYAVFLFKSHFCVILAIVCVLNRRCALNVSHCEASILFWYSEQEKGGVGRSPQDACSARSFLHPGTCRWLCGYGGGKWRPEVRGGQRWTSTEEARKQPQVATALKSTFILRLDLPELCPVSYYPHYVLHMVIGFPHNTPSVCSGWKCCAVVRLTAVFARTGSGRGSRAFSVIIRMLPVVLSGARSCFK